jgi:membrane protein involved in colicin uptake
MATTTPSSSDNSVTFSLAELAKLEQERVREEDTARARAREKELRDQKEAEARRMAAEAARLEAEAQARAKRLREEAEQKARVEARERAAADVMRIEAEARARLEADNAQRAHELALLKVRTESGKRRLQIALAAVIGLAALGGSATAYGVTHKIAAMEQSADQMREGQQALARERENAKATELAALDRRHAALRARPLVSEAAEAGATAEAARKAIDPKSLDHDRLRAFGDALDALQARIEAVEKLAQLDRRLGDLTAWAAERKRGEATAAARNAASRAKATGTEDAVRAYERALDQLHDWLAQSKTPTGGGGAVQASSGPGRPCLAGDPGCGLDGRPIF